MFSSATKNSAQMTEELAQRDIDNKKESIKRDVSQQAEKAVDHMSDYANQAGVYVRDLVDNTSHKIDETNRFVTEEVRNSPLKSVMIAAGVGFVLGALFRSR